MEEDMLMLSSPFYMKKLSVHMPRINASEEQILEPQVFSTRRLILLFYYNVM